MRRLMRNLSLFIVMAGVTLLYSTDVSANDNLTKTLIQIEKKRVITQADQFMDEGPITISAHVAERSAGGIHDFYSEGDYWWPDPDQPDGLPYIRKDGMTNPEIFVKHRQVMRRFSIHVGALVSAYVITGKNEYANKAIEHLRAWFVTDSTMMNPNLNYAQAIPGRTKGRGVGIIDTIHLIEIARAISILENRGELNYTDAIGIKRWFASYLDWLTTSVNGIDEMERENNHGTWWVAQVAEFGRLIDSTPVLEFCRERYKSVLLPNQVSPEGKFPLELERTKPYNYSLFNFDGLALICHIASTPEDNLWTYETESGAGMKNVVEFLYPFIKDKSNWPYEPDVMYFDEWPMRQPGLLFAGLAYDREKYIELWKQLPAEPETQEGIRNFPIRYPLLWVNTN
ncbi:MAG: alginate lyase family protein [Candidatus Marinimicrobia bacterium]|nr:alginate lyase family protein [Candidatus Neomarinimicrobiota bacterium]MCF7828912.1 alginate lyase family protein [Candidatus Neomarinimicrobiota bacterium]MCF7879872.1 alginate lyase family protein [Candidatus Neomarinimicrobiota bacterium]